MGLQSGCTGQKQAGAEPPSTSSWVPLQGGRTGKNWSWPQVQLSINQPPNNPVVKLLFSFFIVKFDIGIIGTGAQRRYGEEGVPPDQVERARPGVRFCPPLSRLLDAKRKGGRGSEITGGIFCPSISLILQQHRPSVEEPTALISVCRCRFLAGNAALDASSVYFCSCRTGCGVLI